jgi:hypothetical protein
MSNRDGGKKGFSQLHLGVGLEMNLPPPKKSILKREDGGKH